MKSLFYDWKVIAGFCAICVLIFIIFLRKVALNALQSNNMKKQKLSIMPSQVIRIDTSGNGNYGTTRQGHTHQGIDLLAASGQEICTPLSGTIVKIGYAYADDKRFNSYHIKFKNGVTMKVLYVNPLKKVGDKVAAGSVIGTAQNIAGKYGGSMQNHVHVELLENGNHFNPTPFFV